MFPGDDRLAARRGRALRSQQQRGGRHRLSTDPEHGVVQETNIGVDARDRRLRRRRP
ncbi:hypothetical protein [Azospirillum endophyticum]